MITSSFEAMARLFEAAPADLGVDAPRPNVSPTQSVPVAVSREDGRLLVPMRWGFVPSWAKAMNDGPLLINARAETLAEKPAFRAAARERRCLIPADGFYEWQGEKGAKTPWVIRPAAGGMLAFAGVWQDWRGAEGSVATCAIVTCAANGVLAPIHHRMPVTVAAEDWALWLGEEGKGAATLMKAAPDDALAFYRVDPKVNSNRASGPELIEPI